LFDYARADFKLNRREPDGHTKRHHLESAAQQGSAAAMIELDEQPDLPYHLTYLWGWFGELAGRRQSNGMDVSPIAWREIEAWARLTGRDPKPWEVQALVKLDDLLLNDHHEAQAAKQKPQIHIARH
jgi:hypothetical protein